MKRLSSVSESPEVTNDLPAACRGVASPHIVNEEPVHKVLARPLVGLHVLRSNGMVYSYSGMLASRLVVITVTLSKPTTKTTT